MVIELLRIPVLASVKMPYLGQASLATFGLHRFWFMNPKMLIFSSQLMPSGGGAASRLSTSLVFKTASSSNSRPRIHRVNALEPVLKNGVKGGWDYRNSGHYNSQLKHVRALSTRRGFTPRASSSGDATNLNLSEKPVEGGKNGESLQSGKSNLDTVTVPKKKRQSRSKKKKKEVSLASVADHSTAKIQEISRNGELLPSAENNSSFSTPVDLAGTSDLSKKLPEKKTSAKKRKGKPLKEPGSIRGTNVITPGPKSNFKKASSTNGTIQSPAPQKVGKIKQLAGNKLQPLHPPRGKSVVVVESVTKANVIQNYLGDMYEVLPSYGHIRDLAHRSGSVRPDDDFSMVWEVRSHAWTHLKLIRLAVTGADNLILASDPDREGEAIAWHLVEMLQQQGVLRDDLTIARVVFHEITESAIKTALQTPRNIDGDLVQAYLARRALDYLIGFNVSPLLWRKLPGCQSAGRVQSAALSLICDRESEIDRFNPQEYWTVDALFKPTEEDDSYMLSCLTHFDSKKLNQFSVGSEAEAKDIEQKIGSSNFKVVGSKRSKQSRNPPTPYITSTLQQDAANKLNFTAAHTMKLAQKLYEGVQLFDGKGEGLITYMRTDGLHISDGAVQDIRSMISERYGQEFVPAIPRKYFTKVKNAQEAHEAIRPTDVRRLPSMLAGKVDEDCLKLYTLIWSRTLACQMEPSKIDMIQVDIGDDKKSILFRAARSRVQFLGFRAVYEDIETKAIKSNEIETDDLDRSVMALSDLKPGDHLSLGKVALKQHHTQPPPRYSEASLVKKLEELGIGRPSTYATTLKVLQDRKYVTVKSRIISPEFRGRMVSAYLSHYFSEVTDYCFTADMETELDNVSAGLTEWKGLLKDYWTRFSSYCDRASKVHIHQVEKMLEKSFGDFLFSSLPDENRTCPSCLEGTLIFKVSRFGAGYFIGCDQHPSCKYIAKTLYGEDTDGDDDNVDPSQHKSVEEPKLLGVHPTSNEKIFLKSGPYGSYVQLGEDRKGYQPQRSSVSQIKDVNSLTLEDAVELLRYPMKLGNHPKDGQPVVLKIAKVGFTIRYRRFYAPVPKNMKPTDVTMERALELLDKGIGVTQSGRPRRKKQEEEVEVS